MLTVVTWLWGTKYNRRDAEKLRAGVSRNLEQPHRFVVISEWDVTVNNAEVHPIPYIDHHLLYVRGCFARLRLFDPAFQGMIGAEDRIVCMDLDSVVTGSLDVLFNRPDNFVILQGANAANPCPYNGSLWMLRVGYRPDIWSAFSIEEAVRIPHYEFPDDQSWFADRLPNASAWHTGSRSGVYAFMKPGWPSNSLALPTDARLVVFPGWRSPEKFKNLDWVQKHWVS